MLEHWTHVCLGIFRAFYLIKIMYITLEFVIIQHGTQIKIQCLDSRQPYITGLV